MFTPAAPPPGTTRTNDRFFSRRFVSGPDNRRATTMSMLEKLVLPEIRELIGAKDLHTLHEILGEWLPPDLAALIVDLEPDEQAAVFRVWRSRRPRRRSAISTSSVQEQSDRVAAGRRVRQDLQRHGAGRSHGASSKSCRRSDAPAAVAAVARGAAGRRVAAGLSARTASAG